MKRSAGILLHVTSLPSNFGIGTLGDSAYKFVDFLQEAGQKYWQILPIGPTGYGDSPYQLLSIYAGNHYFIDLESLCDDGLLCINDFINIDWGANRRFVDYGKIYVNRLDVLKKAYNNFKKNADSKFEEFILSNNYWLDDYCTYMSLKSDFQMKPWLAWPNTAAKRKDRGFIEEYSRKYADKINFWRFVQYKFFEQWNRLKEYANLKEIEIIGDLPIYVAMDGADAWSNSDILQFNDHKIPTFVGGCPPDAFSNSGQLWGNPLYDWSKMKISDYKWWVNRIEHASKLFDYIRLDHFRGFDSYYAVPYSDKTAQNGVWKKGPGIEFFDTLKRELGSINIIAENLGFLTNDVEKLINKTGYPGMNILQFAFDSNSKNRYLPHNYIRNSIVYTGTHDNDTIIGWFNNQSEYKKNFVKQYAGITENNEYNWEMIRLAYSSISDLAIIPMQDFIGLHSECRMNSPSSKQGNWQWRLLKNEISSQLAEKIKRFSDLYGRV